MRAQLRWTGHVLRMNEDRLPKQIFCGELTSGTRRQGGPAKRYKDSLKNTLRSCNISTTGWEALTADRSAWRQLAHEGISAFEAKRLESLDRKRQAKKDRTSALVPDAVLCPTCGRPCASEFGLRAHMRRHRRHLR